MYRFRKENGVLIELNKGRAAQLETLYVNCECSSADHTFRFAYVLDDSGEYIDDELYLECVLCHGGFWYRLKTAFLYLINYKNIKRWNEVLITQNDAIKIKELCDLYLRSNDEIRKDVNPITINPSSENRTD